MNKGKITNFTNEYQLITIALIVAHKWHNEPVYLNKVWSGITGISLVEIDKLEMSFIKSLDFDMFISGANYSAWLKCLRNYIITGKLEYLLIERFDKEVILPSSSASPGFVYERSIVNKVLPPSINSEQNIDQESEYGVYDGLHLDLFQ